jgi:hypothetical protein
MSPWRCGKWRPAFRPLSDLPPYPRTVQIRSRVSGDNWFSCLTRVCLCFLLPSAFHFPCPVLLCLSQQYRGVCKIFRSHSLSWMLLLRHNADRAVQCSHPGLDAHRASEPCYRRCRGINCTLYGSGPQLPHSCLRRVRSLVPMLEPSLRSLFLLMQFCPSLRPPP